MRTHRTTACIACGASNKARMYYFSICTRILQRNLVKLSNPTRVLPKFLVSCRSAEPKKESNSINLDFYKCLNFLLSMSCSIHFLKNPIPQILQSKPIPPTKHCLVCRRKRRSGAQVRYTPLCGVSSQPNGLHCQEGEPQPAPSQQRCKCYDFLYFLL